LLQNNPILTKIPFFDSYYPSTFVKIIKLMYRLLIPFLACFFLTAPLFLRAQTPNDIHYLPFDAKKLQNSSALSDAPCGNAGTTTFGQFLGSSNDVGPSPIYLCFGDSLLVQHNMDADLSGDPDGTTTPGIAYGFFTCPPTSTGPTLQDIIGNALPPIPGDPCLLPGSANGIYITKAVPNGGATWFFNSGALQTTFNGGQPIKLYFAPITVDNFATNTYESSQVGFPPGPCVALNTAAAFEVVYLNEITATGISNNFDNDCLGRFTVRGGYPQYDPNAVYTIKISLASDPSVKAIVHTSASNLFHLSSISFSVPQSGLYNVLIEDGKSCPATFQIDMNVCNPADNVKFTFPDNIVPPGEQICIPVTVDNFAILSASFSMEWDETILQFNAIQNVNPIIAPFFGPANLNTLQTSNGLIGVQIFDNITSSTITIPNGGTLFELCFTALGPLGTCSGLGIINNPAGVSLEDDNGKNLAITVDTGQICISYLPLELSYALFDTTCLGQATLLINPIGGEAPYDIIVKENPSVPGPTYSGIVANSGGGFAVPNVGSTNNTQYNYEICVTDKNGLGITVCTTFVVDIKRLGAQINFVQQPLCNGQSTGTISAVVLQGGVIVANPGSNYTYAWAPANMTVQGVPTQNGIKAGLYTVTITDTNTGCSSVASGTLGQPAPISSQSVVNTKPSCSGVGDGTITYDAEGGTPFAGPSYKYTWIYENTNTVLGSGMDNPFVLGGAFAGEYSVVITDANGCIFIDSNLVLNDLRALAITKTILKNVSCNGQNNGSIALTVTETVPTGLPYTFTWTPSGYTQTGVSPSSTYSGLPAGAYSVVATDILGCKISMDTIITEPPTLSLVILNVVNPGCDQVNSGTICVQALGGTGGLNNYVYSWSQPGGNVTNCQSGLAPGTYTVTVTDQNNCKASMTYSLPVPGAPAFTSMVANEKCEGDGSIELTAATAFFVSYTDIFGVLIDTTFMPPHKIVGLQGGDYIVKVVDATGCTAIDTLTVNGVTPLSFSDTTLMKPSCFGYNDGQIAVGVQDGQPPYLSFKWNPATVLPPNSPVIFGLTAGTYVLTITDNAGCTLTGSFLLGQPPAIVNNFNPITDQVSCFGVCDGTTTAITNYTNGPGTFTYQWNDGGSSAARLNLCAGVNTVIITDAKNCFILDTVVITTPPQITFSALTTNETSCFGNSTGSASITATGGNGGPYKYLWSTGATTQSVSGLKAGVYIVTMTDKQGCTNSVDTIKIGQPAPIGLTTSVTNPTCFGGENGQTKVVAMGGVPDYTYNWEDAAGMNAGTVQTAEMLTAGTYDVTVTDLNGCTSVSNATIANPPPVLGDYEDLTPLNCNGDETILNILSITGGSGGPYRYSVDFGAVLDPNFPVSIGGGKHYITYIDVKDCALTDSIFVAEPAPITVTFNPSVIEVELGATADLQPIIIGPAAIASFTWSNPQGLLNPDTLFAEAYTFVNLTYTLSVQDSFGCSGVGSVMVVVDPNRNVYIPNVFIPANASGLNDHFNINVGLGVETVNYLRIYDRWGALLYQREKFIPNNDNLSEGWDGRFNGDFVSPGVFVYLAEVKFLDGRVLLYRGDVTVVR